MKNIVTAALAVVIIVAAADPALAQFGGGADPGFRQGLNTLLGWVLIVGAAVAVAAFMFACVGLFMRNLMMFAGGVLGVLIGGVLLANAPTIVSSLTRLNIGA